MPKLIYVVDDEENIREILSYNLEKNGYEVKSFENGADFLGYYKNKIPDLVILDLMLPDIDGYEICRDIRNKSKIPVIILSAKGEELDKVLGLELGADDYIVKPFGVRELIARVKNIFKRTEDKPAEAEQVLLKEEYSFGSMTLSIDEERHEVKLDNNLIDLNPKEFKTLTILLRNINNLNSRNDLIKKVWGEDYFGDTRTLDVHIRRIRDKMSYRNFGVEHIRTVHGLGYKIIS